MAVEWIRRNVPTVITWLLLLLAAASSVGAYHMRVEALRDDVDSTRGALSAHVARAEDALADVRVLKARQAEISDEIKSFRRAISGLSRVTTRLETITETLRRAR